MRALSAIAVSTMLLLVVGCGTGELDLDDKDDTTITDPGPDCPPPGKWKCYGDVDKGNAVCVCEGMWDCSTDPNKCEANKQVPPGGGDWKCTYVSEYNYTCTKKGDKNSPPSGGDGWYCYWSDSEFAWKCQRVATPVPTGGGHWTCTVNNETGKIQCKREVQTVPGGGQWDCKTVGGKTTCTKKDENGGLPPGGSGWKCNQTTEGGKLVWVCWGTTPAGGTPPGGNGWNCIKVKTEMGKDQWKCKKPAGTTDYPPGGGYYSCVRGSEFGGTKCEKVGSPPTPPGPTPTKGEQCVPNTRRWCDGLQYCGWGQVVCKADGTWATKKVNGQEVLDCQELNDGRRPNTVCACYHFFYNPSCCERPDCIVPTGSKGQLCPKSAGKLCDYCNPLNPECSTPGALCVVTNSHETFCGRPCSATNPCPANYRCLKVKMKVGATNQCIPDDYSCYY